MKNKAEPEVLRIQDDLYQFVNRDLLRETEIPSDLPMMDSFVRLSLDVEKTLTEDFDRFAAGERVEEIPPLEDAVRLYRKALDVDAREKDGIKPLLPLLEKIRGLKSIADLNANAWELLQKKVSFPFTLELNEDVRDNSRQCLLVMDPSTILPEKTLYDKKLIRFLMLRAYKKMASAMLKLTPLDKKEQKACLKDTLLFDDLLRKKVKSHEEMADYVKLFNVRSTEAVDEAMRPFDLNGLLQQIYPENRPQELVVANPDFIKAFGEIFNEETFGLFVHWSYLNTLIAYAPALSKAIGDLASSYMNKLMGIKEPPTAKKQAFRLASSIYADPIGVYYGRKYFGEKAKKDITEMTQKIIDTYQARMAENRFFTEETKQKAILKLAKIKIKMGYPDKYDAFFDTLKVAEEDSFFDAMCKIMEKKTAHKFAQLNEPTDFGKWAMPAHMVNACYDPFKNDVTFPAAILQKPFYDVEQSVEENLGGIGAVIGHEISHAFDNNGSHLDENGRATDWWKEEDFKKFENLTEDMVAQFDGIPYHGGKVNGRLVVSENIADNGGMAVTLQIMHGLENPDFKAYFVNWAKIWANKTKENFIRLMMASDVHSPSEIRANMTPRNFAEWYEAFGATEGDGMFIPEDKRISIW